IVLDGSGFCQQVERILSTGDANVGNGDVCHLCSPTVLQVISLEMDVGRQSCGAAARFRRPPQSALLIIYLFDYRQIDLVDTSYRLCRFDGAASRHAVLLFAADRGHLMTDLRLFDLNLLIAFDALMAERNVTRAARRVGIGQPAMSYALSRLRALFAD